MYVGYTRVSTSTQDKANQTATINEYAARNGYKVEYIESETITGRKRWKDRQLGAMVQGLTEGDIIICPELSRIGRSVGDVLEFVTWARENKIKESRSRRKET